MERVVILCGGRGARLGQMTAELPKPMVLIGGKPILEHILDRYIERGFREFVLCTGYRGDVIARFVEERKYDADILLSDAGEDASMLARIHAARGHVEGRAVVCYGDTYLDSDPGELLTHHAVAGLPLTIVVADIRSPFGIVESDDSGLVTYFHEKPVLNYYIGMMVAERSLLDGLDQELLSLPDGEGLVSLFDRLITRRELGAHLYRGLQITFNTPDEHQAAERSLARFFTEREG